MAHPLTRFRQDTAISMAELAKLAGTTRQSIHRIENGSQTPSLGLVGRLVAVAGGRLRADDFLSQSEEAA